MIEVPDLNRDTLEEDVPIKEMVVEPAYSRPLDRNFVTRLAKNWDRKKAGVVYLSLRSNGQYAILDGCHRREACRIAEGEDARLPARVFLYLTVAEEAALWDGFNRHRRRPKATDIFRARLVAGEETAVRIAKAVEQAGLKVCFAGVQSKATDIVALKALEEAYHRVGEHGITTILRILREAFGEDLRGFQAPAINGLSMFWAKYGAVADRARIIDSLKLLGPTRMLSMAHEYRALHLGMPLAGAWARILWTQYNRGLRSKTLPEWA